MKNKSQCSHQIIAIVSQQSPSRYIKNKPMKSKMWQSDNVMILNMIVRKFHINPQKFNKFAYQEVFTDCDETEEKSKKDDNYDQVPSLINSKLLFAKIIQAIRPQSAC